MRSTLETLLCELKKVTQQIIYRVYSDVRSIPNPPKGRKTFQVVKTIVLF